MPGSNEIKKGSKGRIRQKALKGIRDRFALIGISLPIKGREML